MLILFVDVGKGRDKSFSGFPHIVPERSFMRAELRVHGGDAFKKCR